MGARERAEGEVPGVLVEENEERSKRRDFQDNSGRHSCTGGRGESNAAGATCRLRVTKVILGKYDNTPLAYTPGLELHHPIMSKIGGHGGQLESERESGQSKLLASLSANNT